jgi:precorrin-8X/cobalt-precorrin-8 methylmutase
VTDFRRYVVTDWSAARPPNTGRDSIWIAVADGPEGCAGLANPPSQPEAVALLESVFGDGPGPVLAGFDFCFGLVAGLGPLVDPSALPPWRAVWQFCAAVLEDDLSNKWDLAAQLNRLVHDGAGPFWGAGLGDGRKSPFPVAGFGEWRRCEQAARATGLRPKSTWQLSGAGAVGLQSLTGIARLEALRARDQRLRVWPFEDTAGAQVVMAEVYPSMFPRCPHHAVRDAAQVCGTARALAAADRSGQLAGWWDCPADDVVCSEEAWILGVHAPAPSDPGEAVGSEEA